MLFLLITCLFWQEGRAVLQEWLFPGDAAVTAGALEDLTANLQNGYTVSAALERFCRTVMDGASLGSG